MRFIILDLEATCTDNRNIYFDNEVIEIGAVKIENKQVIYKKRQDLPCLFNIFLRTDKSIMRTEPFKSGLIKCFPMVGMSNRY